MNTTSASLLERLEASAPAAADWQLLHDLYVPLVRRWLAQAGLDREDAADLAHEVFVVVLREVPAFRRQRLGSFRRWLRLVAANRVRTWRKAAGRRAAAEQKAGRLLEALDHPDGELAARWDREHDEHVTRELLARVRADFEPNSWEAFKLTALDGRTGADAAAATGLTPAAVAAAKFRILKRLREEGRGLID